MNAYLLDLYSKEMGGVSYPKRKELLEGQKFRDHPPGRSKKFLEKSDIHIVNNF